MEKPVWTLVRAAFLVLMITSATILIARGNDIGYVVYTAEIARFIVTVVDAVRKERK